MKKQAINSGVTFIKDSIQDFYVLKDKIILTGEKQTEYHSKSVIFATGININRNTIKGLNDYIEKLNPNDFEFPNYEEVFERYKNFYNGN